MTKDIKTASKKRQPYLSESLKWLLAAIFFVAILLPLGFMLFRINDQSVQDAFSTHSFGTLVRNSLAVASTATVLTILLAYALAIATQRCDIRLKGLFALIFTLPMLVPSISNGMGLIILFGNNGILTRFFHWNGNIYGFGGIVVGSMLYALPVAYLMLSDILRYEDMTPYEAARVLGLSKWRQFTAITWPYLRRPLASVIFSVFALVITDYGVPTMVSDAKFKTLPMVMYDAAVGKSDFAQGAVYGSLLLVPAILAFVIDLFNKDRSNSSFVTSQHEPHKSFGARFWSYLLCSVTSLLMLLPFVAFGLLAFSKQYPNNLTFTLEHVTQTFKRGADGYLLNAIIIALLVGLIGTAVAFITAYFTARMSSGASRFLHLASITTGAIPGLVLGLAYVLAFKGSFLYGTLAILIMVNMVHFFASPYLMIYNSLSKINVNLEPVGQTLGISRIRMIFGVFIPRCRGTLLEMFSYFFVNCMMTISAVSLLATPFNRPVSLMITQFNDQSKLAYCAVIALVILAVNLLMKGIIRLCKREK